MVAGFTWWRHGLRPCEQLPGTRGPGFWLVQIKVFQSPFGGLSWHVLFEADPAIEFYHSLVRWEVSSRRIDPKRTNFEKFVRGGICLQLGCWRGANRRIAVNLLRDMVDEHRGLRRTSDVDQCMLYRGLLLICSWIEVMRRMPSFLEHLSESKHWLCLQTKFGLHNDWSISTSMVSPTINSHTAWQYVRFGRVRTYCNLEYNRCVL